ncbi:hypothetical protein SMI01S_06930 [Sphingobacterium mizutaii NBRC 14946 = DSM 11724]|uniref:Uncharacterized protein n=1 Tax=Sphingobacterium mizutaii NBRC 14946 = DSM 11724 TaxID=1220576 RepID=A0ABQ0VZN3_9SPHI|nr:hypothetical protein SMI01S_06930 [Sphingobacterium mizutaii NBRC 14946 = DSM 11724]
MKGLKWKQKYKRAKGQKLIVNRRTSKAFPKFNKLNQVIKYLKNFRVREQPSRQFHPKIKVFD